MLSKIKNKLKNISIKIETISIMSLVFSMKTMKSQNNQMIKKT